MSWGEAWRLTQKLASDPSSWLAAALNDWPYPLSREAMVTADLYDLQHQAKSKRRPKPHPIRPWLVAQTRKLGGARLSKEALRTILDAHRGDQPTDAEVISHG